jgi:hypothetical protein
LDKILSKKKIKNLLFFIILHNDRRQKKIESYVSVVPENIKEKVLKKTYKRKFSCLSLVYFHGRFSFKKKGNFVVVLKVGIISHFNHNRHLLHTIHPMNSCRASFFICIFDELVKL